MKFSPRQIERINRQTRHVLLHDQRGMTYGQYSISEGVKTQDYIHEVLQRKLFRADKMQCGGKIVPRVASINSGNIRDRTKSKNPQPSGKLNKRHWGRMTHMCVSKLTTIGSVKGLPPVRRQAFIWTNGEVMLIWQSEFFCKISIEMHTILLTKMYLKKLAAKWRSFCLGLNF